MSLLKRKGIEPMRNKCSLFCIGIAATVVFEVTSAGAQTMGVQAADLVRLRSVGAVALSPDASHVAYEVIYRDRPGRPYPRVWVMDITSKKTVSLSRAAESSDPVWSPNGQWIAFLAPAKGNHHAELMIAHPDGSDNRALAPVVGTNSLNKNPGDEVTWSPDSKKIAFVSTTPGPYAAAASGDPMVFKRYNYHTTGFSEGGSIFNDNRNQHIFIADIANRQVRQLTNGNFNEHGINWSPNSDQIVFMSDREPDPDEFWDENLFTVRASDGSIHRLTASESGEYEPRWSPDGNSIVFVANKGGLNTSDSQNLDDHVWVMNADGTSRHELANTPDNRQSVPEWSLDGRAIYYSVVVRGNDWLYRSAVAGGQPEPVVKDLGRVVSFSVGKGGVLAYSFWGTRDLAELYVNQGGTTRQLTNLNTAVLGGRQIAKVVPIWCLSPDYQYEVEGYLTEPVSISPGSKHPLIVDIHGGPNYSDGPEFDFKPQVYATQGWATLTTNYRGSTGYGQKFAAAVFADQDHYEPMDVMYLVSASVRRNLWIDRNRMGIEGTSNGGFFTEWIISQTREFKAAIPTAPMTDLISYTYLTGINYQQQEYGAYMHEGNLLDFIWERSPLRHVSSVATPTLLLSGANDPAATISQVEEYYIALKQVGVPTELVLYPREGHGLAEVGHTIDDINRSIAWYKTYFPPANSNVHTNVQP